MTLGAILARLRTPVVIVALVIAFDQWTKAVVLRVWPEPQSGEFQILGGWLAFTYIRNDGVAFGMFRGIPHVFTVTSILIICGAIYYYLYHLPDDRYWAPVVLGLIVGGALGNVIDRIRYGYVVDFIKTLEGRFPVFNVADSAVVIGVVVMAVRMFLDDARPDPQLQVEAEDGS